MAVSWLYCRVLSSGSLLAVLQGLREWQSLGYTAGSQGVAVSWLYCRVSGSGSLLATLQGLREWQSLGYTAGSQGVAVSWLYCRVSGCGSLLAMLQGLREWQSLGYAAGSQGVAVSWLYCRVSGCGSLLAMLQGLREWQSLGYTAGSQGVASSPSSSGPSSQAGPPDRIGAHRGPCQQQAPGPKSSLPLTSSSSIWRFNSQGTTCSSKYGQHDSSLPYHSQVGLGGGEGGGSWRAQQSEPQSGMHGFTLKVICLQLRSTADFQPWLSSAGPHSWGSGRPLYPMVQCRTPQLGQWTPSLSHGPVPDPTAGAVDTLSIPWSSARPHSWGSGRPVYPMVQCQTPQLGQWTPCLSHGPVPDPTAGAVDALSIPWSSAGPHSWGSGRPVYPMVQCRTPQLGQWTPCLSHGPVPDPTAGAVDALSIPWSSAGPHSWGSGRPVYPMVQCRTPQLGQWTPCLSHGPVPDPTAGAVDALSIPWSSAGPHSWGSGRPVYPMVQCRTPQLGQWTPCLSHGPVPDPTAGAVDALSIPWSSAGPHSWGSGRPVYPMVQCRTPQLGQWTPCLSHGPVPDPTAGAVDALSIPWSSAGPHSWGSGRPLYPMVQCRTPQLGQWTPSLCHGRVFWLTPFLRSPSCHRCSTKPGRIKPHSSSLPQVASSTLMGRVGLSLPCPPFFCSAPEQRRPVQGFSTSTHAQLQNSAGQSRASQPPHMLSSRIAQASPGLLNLQACSAPE